MRIVLLIEPHTTDGPTFAASNAKYVALADEIGRLTQQRVERLTGDLRAVQSSAYVLYVARSRPAERLAEVPADRRAELARRLMLFNVSRHDALARLEELRLAGAVDGRRMSEWQAGSTAASAIYGRPYLAKTLGTTPERAFRSEHFGLLRDNRRRTLPRFLVDYLAADQRSRQPLRRVERVWFIPNLAQPAARIEVATERAVAWLRRERVEHDLSLANLAGQVGAQVDRFVALEEDDEHAELGDLLAYALALEPRIGWRLAESLPHAQSANIVGVIGRHWAEDDPRQLPAVHQRRGMTYSSPALRHAWTEEKVYARV